MCKIFKIMIWQMLHISSRSDQLCVCLLFLSLHVVNLCFYTSNKGRTIRFPGRVGSWAWGWFIFLHPVRERYVFPKNYSFLFPYSMFGGIFFLLPMEVESFSKNFLPPWKSNGVPPSDLSYTFFVKTTCTTHLPLIYDFHLVGLIIYAHTCQVLAYSVYALL